MLQTLRSKILAISTATVVGALAITGAATYHIVRGSTFQTIEQDLDAITAGNTMAIDQWVASKARAVSAAAAVIEHGDRKSTRLNSSHSQISYAVFCLKKKKKT